MWTKLRFEYLQYTINTFFICPFVSYLLHFERLNVGIDHVFHDETGTQLFWKCKNAKQYFEIATWHLAVLRAKSHNGHLWFYSLKW